MKIMKALTGPLSVNTYLVVDEQSNKGFLVDPGGSSKAVADKIREDGILLEYIVLTHGHGDHIGGVAFFQMEFPEVKVVASQAELEILSDGGLNSSRYIQGHDITVIPDIFVEDGSELIVGELTLQFLHTPGHSPGGICILVNKSLFSGDTLFQMSFGRTDLPGGSMAALRKSIREKLFTLPDDVSVYPGHMDETNIGFEKRSNPIA